MTFSFRRERENYAVRELAIVSSMEMSRSFVRRVDTKNA